MFFISPAKLGRCWRNLAHCFPEYICCKCCKRFPPHLNNVSTLPCETWNTHCARTTTEFSPKETPEFIPLQLWPPYSPDLNPGDNTIWEILQNKVYKIRITDLELSTTPLTNGCHNDDMIQLGPLCSQSLFPFVQIVHTCCSPMDSNLANLGATVKVGQILEFYRILGLQKAFWSLFLDTLYKLRKSDNLVDF